MKKYLSWFIICLVFQSALFAQKTVLLETKYYSFQSNVLLNAHLYLYNKAMGCKFRKVQDDSLAYYSFRDKIKMLKPADFSALNPILKFYMDSLLNKDLLFDSLMRDFSDKLGNEKIKTSKWQNSALEKVNIFKPFFLKLFWPAIDAENKAWLKANGSQIAKLETTVVPELEKIYETKLPGSKIRIDLTCYATWAGACSYNDGFCHILFASAHGSNKGDLAAEVVFHETSHFLVDKLNEKLTVLMKGKDIKSGINLWHNMIFYTTGYVLEHYYAREGKVFFPFYVQMKFEDKFPDFKATVDACKQFWNPYINGQVSFDDAVKNIANSVSEKK